MRQTTYEGAVSGLRAAAREYVRATSAERTDWERIKAADAALKEAALVYAQGWQQHLAETLAKGDGDADPR